MLVGFHGYMENARIQMERLEQVSPDRWTLVSIQGLNRFYRGRSEEVVAGWMTREDRETAIADNIDYINRVVAAVRVSDEPVVFTGFSQGVAMAFRAGVRGAVGADAVVAVGGDVPPELLKDERAAFPRILLARGAADEWYTAEKMAADLAALQARGVAVTPVVYDGGHDWTNAIASRIADFLHRHEIDDGPAPK